MPDQPLKTRRTIWLLSFASAAGQLVWVECGRCRQGRRYYRPDDLIKLFGNVDVAVLPLRMRCERCGSRESMNADVHLPAPAERATLAVRRLVDVKVRLRPVWREETG